MMNPHDVSTALFECEDHKLEPCIKADLVTKERTCKDNSIVRPSGPAALHRQAAAQMCIMSEMWRYDRFPNVKPATTLLSKHAFVYNEQTKQYFLSMGNRGWAALGWQFTKHVSVYGGAVTTFYKPKTERSALMPLVNRGFGSESPWKALFMGETEINGCKVLVEESTGHFDLVKYNLMAHRTLSYDVCLAACRELAGRVPKGRKGAPRLCDLVAELVEYFFSAEHGSAKEFMIWHCSGQALVDETGDVDDAVLEVLDEENKHAFVDVEKRKKHATRREQGRSAAVNFTPDELKLLAPPGATIVLQMSFQTVWGSYDKQRFHWRRWNGLFKANRTRLEATKIVLNLLWDTHVKARCPDGRPSDDAINDALDTLPAFVPAAKAKAKAKAKP